MQTISHGRPVGSNNLSQLDSSQGEEENQIMGTNERNSVLVHKVLFCCSESQCYATFKDSLVEDKVAILENEWSTGVAWQTAGPISQP